MVLDDKRDAISVIATDDLIVTEEFGIWSVSRRRGGLKGELTPLCTFDNEDEARAYHRSLAARMSAR